MICEVCVDSVEGALAAQEGGAQRVELCADLVEGGLTPSLGMIRQARQRLHIGVHVLIRPRGGDFLYSLAELAVMNDDIRAARQLGADGVVFGALQADGRVDVEACRALLEGARPLGTTFHRAFDLCREPFEALETIIALGFTRLLTSGQQPTAVQGGALLSRLARAARGRVILMAGGGINAGNLAQVAASGVQEVHFTARASVESRMQHRNRSVPMGKPYQPDEYSRKETDAGLVRAVVEAGQTLSSGQ